MAQVAMRWTRGRRKFIHHEEVIKQFIDVHKRVIGPRYTKEFDKIVANWNHRVKFATQLYVSQRRLTLNVFPKGTKEAKQIWTWNVEGTRAHPITPVRAPALRFRAGRYMAKTGPGGKWYGGPGTVAGGSWVSAQFVAHPGTEPRNWPQVIGDKLKPFWQREIENAWRRGIRRMDR